MSTTLPRANLVVDVYDLDANGTGPLITRQGHLICASGADPARPLVGRLEDRRPATGSRVRVTDANTDWWLHAPTKQTVTVHGGSDHAAVPAPAPRTATIEGDPGTQLPSYLAKRVTVPASILNGATSPEFQTPK